MSDTSNRLLVQIKQHKICFLILISTALVVFAGLGVACWIIITLVSNNKDSQSTFFFGRITPPVPLVNAIYTSELTYESPIYRCTLCMTSNHYYQALELNNFYTDDYVIKVESDAPVYVSLYADLFTPTNPSKNELLITQATEFSFHFDVQHRYIIVITTRSPLTLASFSIKTYGSSIVNFHMMQVSITPETSALSSRLSKRLSPIRPPTRSSSSKSSTRSTPSRPSTRSSSSKPSTRSTPSRPSTRSTPSKPSTRSIPSRPSTRSSSSRSTTTTTTKTDQCNGLETHVIAVYETQSNHFGGYHPTGNATVFFRRQGQHILVLSAYEPTRWNITLDRGVSLCAIYLIGYHEQSLETQLENVKLTTDLGSSPSCGYSWPYNGGGCDTNQLLAKVRQYVGSEITSFYGCYHASNWTISNDLQVASNCGAYGGYQLYTYFPENTTTGGNTQWTQLDFITADQPPCSGSRYLRYNTEYALWVGAILCGTNSRYKLYLSDASDHDFLQIADYGGHGQDHCELVNPVFSITNDDDITSGGCTQCATGEMIDVIDVSVYARSRFGQPFERRNATFWSDLTTSWYECGINIP